MPTRVKITISSNPAHGTSLVFAIAEASLSYSNTQGFLFVSGTPATTSQIKIGATAADTLENMRLRFEATYPTLIVSKVYPDLFIDFPVAGEYVVTTVLNTTAGALTASTEFFSVEVPEPEEEFDIADFSIQIIDTYENDREMIVEITRKTAPKLIFDSGDSILEPLMTSELKFDMRVEDSGDAHFKHLFTGDELRYKVKLIAIDPAENTKLLWQGYLLPDMLREPYVKGNLFIEFTATDMIGVLKGRYFKPWEYHRKINVMRLLGEIMKQTGVTQKFVVMPAFIPESVMIPWYYLNIELSVYYDGKKGENLYELLSSVLSSNLLTLRSFEGYWWLEGVNRKFEQQGVAMLFDDFGVYESEFDVSRKIKLLNFQKGNLVYTTKSPLKNVIINYDGDKTKNLFPEKVVDCEPYFGEWNDNEWNESSQTTLYLDYWEQVGAPYLQIKNPFRFIYGNPGLTGFDYQITEADALNNYFKCKYKPYVLANQSYRFKVELELSGNVFYPLDELVNNVLPNPSGRWSNFILYQLVLNGNEVYSNRKGFNYVGNNLFLKYHKEFVEDYFHRVDFILDAELTFQEEGYLELRFLAPDKGVGFNNLFSGRAMNEFTVEVKKIELVPGDDYEINLTATRPVNFTSEYEQKIKIASTIEIGESGNFGLGMQLTPYEMTIPVGEQTLVEDFHTFNNSTINKLISWRFDINSNVQDILFRKLLTNSIYLTRENGDEDFFNSIYTKRVPFLPTRYMYYLTDKVGGPKYPKNYKFLDKIEAADVLKLLLSNYPEEDLRDRLNWRIYNEETVRTFVQTMATIIHQTHPDNHYVIEGTLIGIYFPGEILQQYFDNEIRDFVASRIEIDLFNSFTTITGREVKYELLTDITYD